MNAEQRARLADARTFAGYRSARISRQTGTMVVVYDEHHANGHDDGGGRWTTLCDDHSFLCTHDTLALAERHAADPLGWCEECMGNIDSDHHQIERSSA